MTTAEKAENKQRLLTPTKPARVSSGLSIEASMSHHLFLLSPTDTPIYSFAYQSTKQPPSSGNTLSTNLPTWSTSPFASTLTALSGAQSASSVRVRRCRVGVLNLIYLFA